jgi:cephalosporin-C deacetylase
MNADFDSFWDAVDAELERYPISPQLQPLPMRSSDTFTTYLVRLTSVGPYRICGYYSVPNRSRPAPGLLLTPRYGSVNHVPDYHDRQRYAVLQLIHRGQRLADHPFAAEYPGLLTLGIERPETYIYRGIVADCLRGAEFLLSRPEVDLEHTAIQGDDLALLTAARRAGFSAVQVQDLLLHRLMDAAEITSAYPVEELSDYLRFNPGSRDSARRTLALFDPLQFAPRVQATTLLTAGDDGAVGGTSWLQPLRDALGGPSEMYRLSHEGATDHDWIDAWLAQRLGSEPRSRFLEYV